MPHLLLLFQELPDELEQCGYEVEMKIDVVLTDPPYNVRQELGRQTSDYDLLSEDNTTEMVALCGDNLKVGVHTYIFCSSIPLLLWVLAVSALTESVTFRDSEVNGQVQEEALFDQEKQVLVSLKNLGKINRSSRQRSLHRINMIDQTVFFWRRSLDLDPVFLSKNDHTQVSND